MRMLIKIVFVIFIANGIDCLGGVCDNYCDNYCDNCCDCFKEKDEYEEIKEYEEISKDEKIKIESLVNNIWYNAKKENLVLKIFKKKDDNVFPSKKNEDKNLIKLKGEDNSKIEYLNETEDPLRLGGKKYAFFEIKTNTDKTVYLYCSDVESFFLNGIFDKTTHVSISVIACDTSNVTNMAYMFYECKSLTKLDLKNFNTKNVTNMQYMFYECSKLTELDLQNFNTTKVTNMWCMFFNCSSLENLKLDENFKTEKDKNKYDMFYGCNLPKETQNKILGINE